jgi:hypothetical protein
MEAQVHSKPRTAISLKLDKKSISLFSNLFQNGFRVESLAGRTVKMLLCEDVGVEEDYLKDRFKTILLDGKPVDDVNGTSVNDGNVLALSAVIGGLVGTTLRRGSYLSFFRRGITYQKEKTVPENNKSVVIVMKLFNLLINELGPKFLEKGIIINREAMEQILNDGRHELKSAGGLLVMDGKELRYGQPYAINWSRVTEELLLKAFCRPE